MIDLSASMKWLVAGTAMILTVQPALATDIATAAVKAKPVETPADVAERQRLNTEYAAKAAADIARFKQAKDDYAAQTAAYKQAQADHAAKVAAYEAALAQSKAAEAAYKVALRDYQDRQEMKHWQ
jgi:hypothetical protein